MAPNYKTYYVMAAIALALAGYAWHLQRVITERGVAAQRSANDAQIAVEQAGTTVREAQRARAKAEKSADQARDAEVTAKSSVAQAQRQLRMTEAHRLAALSRYAELSRRPQAATLLAVEALRWGTETAGPRRGEPLVASHQNLLDRLQQIGGRPVVGHSDLPSRNTI